MFPCLTFLYVFSVLTRSSIDVYDAPFLSFYLAFNICIPQPFRTYQTFTTHRLFFLLGIQKMYLAIVLDIYSLDLERTHTLQHAVIMRILGCDV